MRCDPGQRFVGSEEAVKRHFREQAQEGSPTHVFPVASGIVVDIQRLLQGGFVQLG